MSKCNASGCRREMPLQEWAGKVGLLESRDETVKDYAIRCLTFMFGLHGREMACVASVLAEAAQIEMPEPDVPSADLDWLASVPALPGQDHKEIDIPEV